MRRRFLSGKNILIPESDIVLYDSTNNREIIICNTDYNLTNYPKNRYTPIGIVVIPQSHSKYLYPINHICYNKPIMMSLVYMRLDTPDTGGEYKNYNFGDNNKLINTGYTLYVTVSNNSATETPTASSTLPYVASTLYNNVESKAAPKTFYRASGTYSPSLFLYENETWKINPAFYNYNLSTCGTYDIDGFNNTKKLLLNATSENYQTVTSLTESCYPGYLPSACACWRYHTVADKQGDWYLPALKELSYVMPFYTYHQSAVNKINSVYGSTLAYLVKDSCFWSSTEASSEDAWLVNSAVGVYGYAPKYYNYCIKAFRPVKLD